MYLNEEVEVWAGFPIEFTLVDNSTKCKSKPDIEFTSVPSGNYISGLMKYNSEIGYLLVELGQSAQHHPHSVGEVFEGGTVCGCQSL